MELPAQNWWSMRTTQMSRPSLIQRTWEKDSAKGGRMLQTLLQQRVTTVSTVSSTPEGFPLKTVNEVMNMEEKLMNTNVMSELVATVADIGGNC